MVALDKKFVIELKIDILQSRYNATKLVNKELILLYFGIGKKIKLKTKQLAWGSKVLEQISKELQNELPGLKGFSATNLQRMSLVYEFWNANKSIYPTLSGKFQDANNDSILISPTLSD